MAHSLPIVMVPGLLCSARLYTEQLAALWSFGPVMIAEHRHDDTMSGIARRILDVAPPRFALVGLSMGGYIALEMMHQAPERVAKLALLDTTARPDAPEQSEKRRELMQLARTAGIEAVVEKLWPILVHCNRLGDDALKQIVHVMAQETGTDAFVRQQTAIIHRADSRPLLATLRCPTLIMVGEGDVLIPPERSAEMARNIEDSKLVMVKDAGHLTTLEQPAAVNQALVEWMGG